jgi:hypothetical protein
LTQICIKDSSADVFNYIQTHLVAAIYAHLRMPKDKSKLSDLSRESLHLFARTFKIQIRYLLVYKSQFSMLKMPGSIANDTKTRFKV